MSTCFPSIEITAHSQQGNSHAKNEDSWGSYKNLVWVIDGASNPKTSSDEVVSFVNALNAQLKDSAANNPHASLATILAASISATAQTENVRASATVALCRFNEDNFDYLVLGDAGIVFMDANSDIKLLRDTRLQECAVEERQRYRELLKAGAAQSEIEKAHLALVEAESKLRNTTGGFWVAETDPNAACHAHQGNIENTQYPVILGTDGFIGLAKPSVLFSRTRQTESLPHKLAEVTDALLPQSGKIDDATVITVSPPSTYDRVK